MRRHAAAYAMSYVGSGEPHLRGADMGQRFVNSSNGTIAVVINLTVPRANGKLEIAISPGGLLYVLGANGVGKSSLMHSFYVPNSEHAQRITAHRQTWFGSNAVTLSPSERRQWETNIAGTDRLPGARWTENYGAQRTGIALYDLVDAENVRARGIASAVDGSDIKLAKELAKQDAPIKLINQLLRQSNIPIEISIHESDQVVARKAHGEPYSIAELSDGERNALLVAATVLTAKSGTLLLIDEPERHLHRSIISPLITLLTATRPDCYFVISTHEVMLPIDNPSAQTLLVRDCFHSGKQVFRWDAELMPANCSIGDELKKDILGARTKVVFVEGEEGSLDKPLYSIVFPGVSIVAKASCRDVEHAVAGIRGAEDLHWIQSFGIVDNDRRVPDEIEALKVKGVYALSVFAVESIYYDAEIQRRVVARLAAVTGDDPAKRVAAAKGIALATLKPHIQRLSERVALNEVRGDFLGHIPGKDEIESGSPVIVTIDVAKIVKAEVERLRSKIEQGDLATVIARYPVRETPVLSEIARNLGFQSRAQYESAVRTLLMEDKDAVTFVSGLFGDFASQVGS